jgi:hypothetical protein
MSRSLSERGTGNKATVARSPAVTPASRQERQLELESRLRIVEADACWQRWKDMILVGSLAYVVLGSFTVWAVVLLSGAYPSAEKQLITGFIVQLLINLFLVVAGKKLRWKEGAE